MKTATETEVCRTCTSQTKLNKILTNPWYCGLKWTATALGIVGATTTACGGPAHMAQGFTAFLISSIMWCAIALTQKEGGLLTLQAFFVVIDVVGMWKWW